MYSVSQYNNVVIDIFKGVISLIDEFENFWDRGHIVCVFFYIRMQILRGALQNGHTQTRASKTMDVPKDSRFIIQPTASEYNIYCDTTRKA